jgi:hypothetical protein
MPLVYSRADELRYLISVDERYLAPSEVRPGRRIVANHVTLAVHFPSLSPATRTETGSDVLHVTIGNMRERAIAQSLDGSSLNHFSTFTTELPREHGLRVRLTANAPYVADRVYFLLSDKMDLRIECTSNMNVPRGTCTFEVQWPGEPYIGTAFSDWAMIGRWEELARRLRSLYRMQGRARLDPPGLIRR